MRTKLTKPTQYNRRNPFIHPREEQGNGGYIDRAWYPMSNGLIASFVTISIGENILQEVSFGMQYPDIPICLITVDEFLNDIPIEFQPFTTFPIYDRKDLLQALKLIDEIDTGHYISISTAKRMIRKADHFYRVLAEVQQEEEE